MMKKTLIVLSSVYCFGLFAALTPHDGRTATEKWAWTAAAEQSTNIVTRQFVEDLGITGGGGVTTNAVKDIVEGYGYVTKVVTNGLESSSHAETTYQPKGSYLTSENDPTAYSKITNAVNSGYLCTVDATSDMTNSAVTTAKAYADATFLPKEYGNDGLSLYYGENNSLNLYSWSVPCLKILGDSNGVLETGEGWFSSKIEVGPENNSTRIVNNAIENCWSINGISVPDVTSGNTFALTSDIQSTNGLITAQAATNIVKDATNALATVAHSGSYNDLSNKPAFKGFTTNDTVKIAASDIASGVIPTTYLSSASSTDNSITVTPNTGAATTLTVNYEYGLRSVTAPATVTCVSCEIVSATDINGTLNVVLPAEVANKSADFILRVVTTGASQLGTLTISGGGTVTPEWLCDALTTTGKIAANKTTIICFSKVAANTYIINAQEVK